MKRKIGIRWTIGNVNPLGLEALRLSIWWAWKIFGPEAAYAVCVNSVPLDRARELTGNIPEAVIWHESTIDQLPSFLRRHFDEAMVEGVGWKFAPIRIFPDAMSLRSIMIASFGTCLLAFASGLRPRGIKRA